MTYRGTGWLVGTLRGLRIDNPGFIRVGGLRIDNLGFIRAPTL